MQTRYYGQAWRDRELPIFWLEDRQLNMFQDQGVEIGAIIGCASTRGSFKTPAVAGLIRGALMSGVLRKDDIVIENTSGRAGVELAHLLRGIVSDLWLVMKPDVPMAKQGLSRLCGARIILPDIGPGKTGITTARRIGGGGWDAVRKIWNTETMGGARIINLDQYAATEHVSYLYRTWAVPKILDAFPGEFDYLVVAVGTGGT